MPEFIQDLEKILISHSALIDVKKSLHVLFSRMPYHCEKDYPVAIVHEKRRIKEDEALKYFKENYLLDEDGLSYEEYPRDDLDKMIVAVPKYIQTVDFMLSKNKEIHEATFFNKLRHDYWKKIRSVEGLEAVIDISVFTPKSTICEAEASLRAIIRKRKEVHELKKIAFVWIVEVGGENPTLPIVMKHYFENNIMEVKKNRKTYYLAWATPLSNINMRYFVCPPE